MLNPAEANPVYRGSDHNREAKYTPKRASVTPKDNGMGSILAYADAGTYREDTSRMGGVTTKVI